VAWQGATSLCSLKLGDRRGVSVTQAGREPDRVSMRALAAFEARMPFLHSLDIPAHQVTTAAADDDDDVKRRRRRWPDRVSCTGTLVYSLEQQLRGTGCLSCLLKSQGFFHPACTGSGTEPADAGAHG
jgi:hypothetical protein